MSEERSLPEEEHEESTALCAIVFYNNKFVEIYNKDATLQDICEALGIDVFNTEAYIVDRTTRHAVATLPSDCLPLISANTTSSRQEIESTAHEHDNNNTTFVDFWGEANADNNISVAEEDQENEEGVQKKVNNHIVLEFELVTPNLHETSSEHQSEESEYEEESEENTERQHQNKHDEDDEQHEENSEHHNIALHESEHAHSSTLYAMEDDIDNDGKKKIGAQALNGDQEEMQSLFKLARKWHAVELLTAELPHRLATLPHYDPTTSAADLLTGIMYHAGVYNPHRPQYDPLFDSKADCTSVSDSKCNAIYVNSVEPYCVGSSVSSALAQRPDIHPLTTEELEQIYRHHSSSTDKNIINV